MVEYIITPTANANPGYGIIKKAIEKGIDRIQSVSGR